MLARTAMKKVFYFLILITAACKQPEPPRSTVDTAKAKQLVEQYGCTGCHEIPGLGGVRGMGPSLVGIAARPTIANALPNNPANVARYIENPQAVDPAATMPNLGVQPADASLLAAYLATLK